MAGLTIGKLAAAEGVGVETIRYYQRRGLLDRPARGGSAYREYSEADRWRLAFIRRAAGLGFTLAEIADLLGPAQGTSTEEIGRAAQAKLVAIEDQVRELTAQRCRLRRLVQVCATGSSADCLALKASSLRPAPARRSAGWQRPRMGRFAGPRQARSSVPM